MGGEGLLDVIHGLLAGAGAGDVFHQFLEGHIIEHIVGGIGQFLVDQADGDFSGRRFHGSRRFLYRQTAFEAANDIADANLAGSAGEAIPPAAADFGFEKSAAAQGEEDGFKEFVGEVFVLGEVFGLDEITGPKLGELDDSAQAVFGSLR